MSDMLKVSNSPHVFKKNKVRTLMTDVLVALIPTTVMSVWWFGWYSLAVIAVSVGCSVLTEFLIQKIRKKPIMLVDRTAIVTGVLLALNMPPQIPLWIPAIGAVFAIAIVKQLFGGTGQNFMNPALAARCVLLICWPAYMTTWYTPGLDAVSSATPLAVLKTGALPDASLFDMLIGNIPGCLGETCALAIIAGFIYLLARKTLRWHIPVIFVGTVFVGTTLLAPGGPSLLYGLREILSGGLMLGAVFMATDYSSSPINVNARCVYAFGCGVFTILIRLYGGYPEGVSFAILIMNLAAPLLERMFKQRVYGKGGVRVKER